MTIHQPRDRSVPCVLCLPRTHRMTTSFDAVCDSCHDYGMRLATLVDNPNSITETLYGPRLDADACTEADTAAAYGTWLDQKESRKA
jgi:hypothetical protein